MNGDLALPRAAAARLAGVSLRQLDYWSATGLVNAVFDGRVGHGASRVGLYDLGGLMELLVTAELRRRGVSLQHVRQVVHHLRSRGYDAPLRELRFAGQADGVYFQHSDGSWEGDQQADQLVAAEVLDLEPLRTRIAQAGQRAEETSGRIEQRRGVMGGKPVIAGTRIPVSTVARYLTAGYDDARILRAYPALTQADLNAVRAKLAA